MDRSTVRRLPRAYQTLSSPTFTVASLALFLFTSLMSMMTAVEPRRGFEMTSMSACSINIVDLVVYDHNKTADHECTFDGILPAVVPPVFARVTQRLIAISYDLRASIRRAFNARGPPAGALA